jgi:uncharacterized protein YyaL (SSP411 family)
VRQGIEAVGRELSDAVRAGTASGSVMHAEAASLLLTEYARYRDTISLAVARRALDVMLDTMVAAAGEDPPRLVRAALVGSLAKAWVVTGESRYRAAGRTLVRGLARELPNVASLTGDAVFADQQSYVIENLMLAAATLGEPAVEQHARAALDVLLQRTYAHGWGVRHAVAGSPASGATPQGLLQDQVRVASACLAAHQLSTDTRYLDVALDLAAILERAYADSLGGYYDAAAPPGPPQPLFGDRAKPVLDDVLPGANPSAARVLAHLSDVTGDPSYRRRAQATLEAFAGNVSHGGIRTTTFLAAARETLGGP